LGDFLPTGHFYQFGYLSSDIDAAAAAEALHDRLASAGPGASAPLSGAALAIYDDVPHN
jgi:hypothetical protein